MDENKIIEKVKDELQNALSGHEKIIEEKIKKKVSNSLWKVLTIIGITNIAAFIVMLVYVVVVIPEKAVEIALTKIKADISDSLNKLEKDSLDAFRKLGTVEGRIKDLEKRVSIILETDAKDIDKAVGIIRLINEEKVKDISGVLSTLKALKTELELIVQGKRVLEKLSIRSLEVVDHNGNLRTHIGIDSKKRYFGIRLLDGDGRQRADFVTDNERGRPTFKLKDAKEQNRVSLYENESGYAGLGLIDSKGKWRMILTTAPKEKDGRPSFALKDAKGQKRVDLYENESGYAGLGLMDSKGNWRMTLTTAPKEKDGTPKILFKDREGKIIKEL